MHPNRNTDRITINALLQVLLAASVIIPVAIIAIVGAFAFGILPSNGNITVFVLVVLACVIVVLLGVLIINYFVQRRIKGRFLALVDVCRQYAGGDHTIRATVTGNDEFAQLTRSLNTLLDNQILSTATSNDAAALQAQIEKLLQEVSAVGDGDLRVQAEVTPDTLGVLADSFNYMIEELAKVVGHVQATAVQVTNATRTILGRSAELVQASETQVAQISHTTESVAALAIFIQNVARNAQSSAETAQEALRNATRGQQAVRQTIEGMVLIRENVQETSKKIKRLGERSNEISEIVRIIDDIADQTNLLALNAAIQSAMAGEHGRGFAVVADEIRLLAERSTESTKRIATLVKSIQGDTYEVVVAMEDSTQRVVKGSQLADDAGHSLNSIYTAVERQAQMIEIIAQAANGQATVSEAVAVAMGQISEITRQTNAGTREAAASVRYLSELSDQLRTSVSTFRLPDTSIGGIDVFSTQKPLPSQSSGGANLMPWEQNSPMNFPLLPEPRYIGSVAALPAHAGHPPFGNQQDLSSQPSFVGQQQPSFSEQQYIGSQPHYEGRQQQYGNQPSFAELSNVDNHESFNSQQEFGATPAFGDPGQSLYPAHKQVPVPQRQNTPPPQRRQVPGQSGQASTQQEQWLRESQQNQSLSEQDQWPFPSNGH